MHECTGHRSWLAPRVPSPKPWPLALVLQFPHPQALSARPAPSATKLVPRPALPGEGQTPGPPGGDRWVQGTGRGKG